MKPCPVLILCALATLHTVRAQTTEPANLFPEGDFESAPQLQSPHPSPFTTDPMTAQEGVLYIEPGDYQGKGCSVSVVNENGSNFIRYQAPVGFNGILRTYIALKLPDPAPAMLRISLRWRMADYANAAGAPEWASAQNDPMFIIPQEGQKPVAKTMHGTLRLRQNTNGEWQEVEKSVAVPAGARMVVMQPGLYLTSGTLDVDDIKIFPEGMP